MGEADIVSYITLGAVIIGSVVNISGLVGKRESKAASNARMEVKLDNIYTKVDSIEKKQLSFEGALQAHDKRITRVEVSTEKVEGIAKTINIHGERIRAVEASAKSAHLRINGLEGKKIKEGN